MRDQEYSGRPRCPRSGLSAVELLVVCAILGLLLGLILGGVQAVRTAAARADCQSRMHQLVLAAHHYHADRRQLPEGVAYPFAKTVYEIDALQPGISWQTAILPYIEQDAIWRRAWAAHTSQPDGDSPEHTEVATVEVKLFRCPNDSRVLGRYDYEPAASQARPWGLTNYLGVAGTGLLSSNGVFHPNVRVSLSSISDGTSNTMMIGERPTGKSGYGSSWYSGWGTLRYSEGQLMPISEEWANAPVLRTYCTTRRNVFEAGKYDDPCHQKHFWSLHPGGANFAFADGSVRFVAYSAAPLLPALATRAGNEPAVLPD
jgi:prepilin-type processing-associated H-X9-DG protein